ncbi:hypothetical protein AGMMS50230_11350 [Spirochaetia bacterium]|nr:hypothetical protein AGMMS50230_11350 [Spirochaetia bacterium]
MLPLVLAILAVAASVAVIVIAVLNWDRIIEWFRSRQNLKQSDKDNIAFTLKEKWESGQYGTVQGIFNTRTGELLDAEKTHAKSVDEKVAEIHSKEELVLYN